MEFGQASGENINDFYQDAATSTEVSTFHRIQKTIGETILTRFVSTIEDDSSSCLIGQVRWWRLDLVSVG